MSGSLASDAGSSTLGPVSAALIEELREDARKFGVLVWLDKDGTYTKLVDGLVRTRAAAPHGEGREGSAGRFPFPVFAYRGSFLELMLGLDGLEDGVTMQPFVLHMPGFNEEDVAETPVYELYRSGRRHRVALPTLIRNAAQGKVVPAEI